MLLQNRIVTKNCICNHGWTRINTDWELLPRKCAKGAKIFYHEPRETHESGERRFSARSFFVCFAYFVVHCLDVSPIVSPAHWLTRFQLVSHPVHRLDPARTLRVRLQLRSQARDV